MQKSHVYDPTRGSQDRDSITQYKLRLRQPCRYKTMFSANRYRYIQNYIYAFWTITNYQQASVDIKKAEK